MSKIFRIETDAELRDLLWELYERKKFGTCPYCGNTYGCGGFSSKRKKEVKHVPFCPKCDLVEPNNSNRFLKIVFDLVKKRIETVYGGRPQEEDPYIHKRGRDIEL